MSIGAFIGLVVGAITVNIHFVSLAVFALGVNWVLSVTAIRFVSYERVAVCKAGWEAIAAGIGLGKLEWPKRFASAELCGLERLAEGQDSLHSVYLM